MYREDWQDEDQTAHFDKNFDAEVIKKPFRNCLVMIFFSHNLNFCFLYIIMSQATKRQDQSEMNNLKLMLVVIFKFL